MTRWFRFPGWLALVAPAVFIALGAAPPAQDAGLAQLDRLVGTWDGRGTFVDSAYSKVGAARATTTCAWSNDRLFLICQQSTVMNGNPDHDVAIYTYDAAAKKYHFYNIGLARANSTQLTATADTLTYTDTFADGAKQVTTRTLNVWDSPQRYAWRAEYSLDGGAHWTLMGSGTSARMP